MFVWFGFWVVVFLNIKHLFRLPAEQDTLVGTVPSVDTEDIGLGVGTVLGEGTALEEDTVLEEGTVPKEGTG